MQLPVGRRSADGDDDPQQGFSAQRDRLFRDLEQWPQLLQEARREVAPATDIEGTDTAYLVDVDRLHLELPLPPDVDAARVEVQLEHGLLQVLLPKTPSSRPRRIPVRVRPPHGDPDGRRAALGRAASLDGLADDPLAPGPGGRAAASGGTPRRQLLPAAPPAHVTSQPGGRRARLGATREGSSGIFG